MLWRVLLHNGLDKVLERYYSISALFVFLMFHDVKIYD